MRSSPMVPGDDSKPTPESILEEYLTRLPPGSEPDVDVLCSQHPASADRLRTLASTDRRFADALRRALDRQGAGAEKERAPARDVAAGDKLGEFRLTKLLGSGGMGQVWEAEQVSLDRRVAVKLLHRFPSGLPDVVLRFHREAEAAARLQHPNIVAIYEVCRWEGRQLIVQELLRGGTLQAKIDGLVARSPELDSEHCRWAADICAQVALALQHAHDHNVIHRDVKPGNVLFTESGTPKVADFGLAKVTDKFDLSRSGMVVGTPYYMSPEQIAGGRGGIDARTDVYSLGVVLYQLLSLRHPFRGSSQQELTLEILTGAPRSLRRQTPAVPADLEAVCLKAIAKSPNDRYQTVGELAQDLRRFLHGESTVARPVGSVIRLVRRLKQLATSTLVSVAVLLSLGWIVVDRLLLRPAAEDDVALHAWRMGAVGASAVALGWILANLGRRLRWGGRGAVAGGWMIAAATALGLGWQVATERDAQVHAGARDSFALLVRRPVDPALRQAQVAVEDIDAYVSSRGDHFSAADERLVAHAYLFLHRPVLAEAWALPLAETDADHPASWAAISSVHEALGRRAPSDAAMEALWACTNEDWEAWSWAAEILVAAGRHGDARRAYERAGSIAGSDQGALNRKMAWLLMDLCEYEVADGLLPSILVWNPDSWSSNHLALQIAQRVDDPERARHHLEMLEAAPDAPTVLKIAARDDYLRWMGRHEEAERAARAALEEYYDDPNVVQWSAYQSYDRGTRLVEQGSTEEDRNEGIERLESARDLYVRFGQLPDAPLAAANASLSAVYAALGDASSTDRTLRFQDAAAAARRAVSIDDTYFQAHYNLGEAVRWLAQVDHDVQEPRHLPVEDIRAVLAHYEAAIERNGSNEKMLRNAAYLLVAIYEQTQDPDALERGLEYARRSVRLVDSRREASSCPRSAGERLQESRCHDTHRELLELADDLPAALAAARAALEVLPEGHRFHEKRRRALDDLSARLEEQGLSPDEM